MHSNFAISATALCDADGYPAKAQELITKNFSRPRALSLLEKSLTDASPLVRAETREFMAPARTSSPFMFGWENELFMRVPINTPIAASTLALVGGSYEDGTPVPVSAGSFAPTKLTPKKAQILVSATKELVKGVSSAGITFVGNEMRAAAAGALNKALLDEADANLDSGSVFTSSGSAVADLRVDLKNLLDAVVGNHGLLFIASPDVTKHIATVTLPTGGLAYPGVGPSGGELLCTPIMACDQAEAGSLYLIDCSAFAADLGGFSLTASGHASLQMSDSPSGDGAQLVSMFQTDSVALKAVLPFGLDLCRENAVAKIEGIGA